MSEYEDENAPEPLQEEGDEELDDEERAYRQGLELVDEEQDDADNE